MDKLTEKQVREIHEIIERHSGYVVDYELATDDINAYLLAEALSSTSEPPWNCPNSDHACNLRGYCVNKNCERFRASSGGTPVSKLLEVVCPACGYDFPPRVANYPNAHCPNCRHDFNYAVTNAAPSEPQASEPQLA